MRELTIRFITPPDPISDAEFVREKVFQEEQGIRKELDFDGKDHEATHIVVYLGNQPVGAGRIRTIETEKVKIERVAVISEMRGKGIGKAIMRAIDEHLRESEVVEASLDAQLHAKAFYENVGYEQEGDVFEEVGIPHIVMTKRYKSRS